MNKAELIFPGWMVETGYKYAKVAAIAWEEDRNLGLQSEVNAALAVEILLKSLLAGSVANDNLGKANTNFEVRPGRKINKHSLYDLYTCIPASVQEKLNLDNHKYLLKEKALVFTDNRYDYEPTSNGYCYDDSLLHLAAELIPKIVDHFLELGSKDDWLLFYKNHPELYALPTGIAIR